MIKSGIHTRKSGICPSLGRVHGSDFFAIFVSFAWIFPNRRRSQTDGHTVPRTAPEERKEQLAHLHRECQSRRASCNRYARARHARGSTSDFRSAKLQSHDPPW